MILSMAGQAKFFLWTMLLGGAAGVAYDMFRITRKTFKHPDFLTQIEDLVYWLFATVLIFYFVLHLNSGEVRVYAIIGLFLGMLLYFATLSLLVMKASVFIIGIIKKIIATTIELILFPIKLLANALSYPARAAKRWAVKRFKDGRSTLRKTNRLAGVKVAKFKREISIIRRKI